jgi:hypothetical protein
MRWGRWLRLWLLEEAGAEATEETEEVAERAGEVDRRPLPSAWGSGRATATRRHCGPANGDSAEKGEEANASSGGATGPTRRFAVGTASAKANASAAAGTFRA